MGKDKSRGGGSRRSTAACPASDAPSADDAAAQKARDKELRLECAKAFGYYNKGNAKQGTKEVEKLLRAHPTHPLPHFVNVRIAHKMALHQRREASLRKQFKDCHERASAALAACPDSLVVRLMFAEVVYDNPFPSDEDMAVLRSVSSPENLPTSGLSADLKLVKSISTFDEEVRDLPMFPDMRQCGNDVKAFAMEAKTQLKNAEAQTMDIHRESGLMVKRDMMTGGLFATGGRGVMGGGMNNAMLSRANGEYEDANPTLTHYLMLRSNKHQVEALHRKNKAEQREQQERLQVHREIEEQRRVRVATAAASDQSRRDGNLEKLRLRDGLGGAFLDDVEAGTSLPPPRVSEEGSRTVWQSGAGSGEGTPGGDHELQIVKNAMAKRNAAEEMNGGSPSGEGESAREIIGKINDLRDKSNDMTWQELRLDSLTSVEAKAEAVIQAAEGILPEGGRAKKLPHALGNGTVAGSTSAGRVSNKNGGSSKEVAERARAAEAAKKRTENLKAVKRYWKGQVERDPMAILSLTDVPLKSLREYCEGKFATTPEPKKEMSIMRGIIRERIHAGRWRLWRCSKSEVCCNNGLHLSPEELFKCLERRIPRDVKRDEAGDASTWLIPMALPSDVNLGGYVDGGKSEAMSRGKTETETGAVAGDKGEAGHVGKMLERDTNACACVPEVSCKLGKHATPAYLANCVGGRPAPLLSADNEVFRPEAVEDEWSQQQQQQGTSRFGRGMSSAANMRRGGAFGAPDDAGSSSDEETYRCVSFDQINIMRNLEARDNYPSSFRNVVAAGMDWELPRSDDRELRAVRLALVHDALSRMHQDPMHSMKLREHLLHPALLPPVKKVLQRGRQRRGGGLAGSVAMATRDGSDSADTSLDDASVASPEDFGNRTGDEFLDGYLSAEETYPVLLKGRFVDRIKSAEIQAHEEAEKDEFELADMARQNGILFGQAQNSRNTTPSGHLLQYAEKAHQLWQMRATRETIDLTSSKTPVGLDDAKAVYGIVASNLTSTEAPRSVYAPAVNMDEHLLAAHGEDLKALKEEITAKAAAVVATCQLPSWVVQTYSDEPSFVGGVKGMAASPDRVKDAVGAQEHLDAPPASDETKINDIVTAMQAMTEARLMPLRLVQAIAQYVATREEDLKERRRAAREECTEGIRNRRKGGARSRLGAPERVLAGSPEATIGRTLPHLDNFGGNENEHKYGQEPIRLDDFGPRLRNLPSLDLAYLWVFMRRRWAQKQRVLTLTFMDCETQLPDVLSEDSPLFGLTDPVEGTSKAAAGDAKAAETPAHGGTSGSSKCGAVGGPKGGAGKKKKGTKGKGGGGGRDAGEDKFGRDWCPEEASRVFRLCKGVWTALYPPAVCSPSSKDSLAVNNQQTPAGSGAASSVVPVESFLGERLVNWIYSDASEEYQYTVLTDEVSLQRYESDLARLDANNDLLQELLVAKLKVRREVDEIVVMANRVLTDYRGTEMVRQLDPNIPTDVDQFRHAWEAVSCLRFKLVQLQMTLLNLDLAELELERCEIEKRKVELTKQETELKKLQLENQEPRRVVLHEEKSKFTEVREQKEQLLKEANLRLRLCVKKMEDLEHQRGIVDNTKNAKLRKMSRLERSKHYVAVECVHGRTKLSEDRLAEVEAEIQLWIVGEKGKLPDKTIALLEKIRMLPRRMTMPLVCAQERLLALDIQMEALLCERAQVVGDLHQNEAKDNYQMIHKYVMGCLRLKLETAAAEAVAAEAVATRELEQERLLAEEGQADQEKKRKEEKARAKKAREKAKEREKKEREAVEAAQAAAEDAAKAKAAMEAAAAEAEANKKAKALARAKAEAAAEQELAARRAQLEQEEKAAKAEDERMIEEAKAASAALAHAKIIAEAEAAHARAAAEQRQRQQRQQQQQCREEMSAVAAAKLATDETVEAAATEKMAVREVEAMNAAAHAATGAAANKGGTSTTSSLKASATDFKPSGLQEVPFIPPVPPMPSGTRIEAAGDPPASKGRGKTSARSSSPPSSPTEAPSSKAPPPPLPGQPPPTAAVLVAGPNGVPIPVPQGHSHGHPHGYPLQATSRQPVHIASGGHHPGGVIMPAGALPPAGYFHHGGASPGMVYTQPGTSPYPIAYPAAAAGTEQGTQQLHPQGMPIAGMPVPVSMPVAMPGLPMHYGVAHVYTAPPSVAVGVPVAVHAAPAGMVPPHGMAVMQPPPPAATVVSTEIPSVAEGADDVEGESTLGDAEGNDEQEWPTLALPAPPQAANDVETFPDPDVDDGGFAMDDMKAAIEASMLETKRPKQKLDYATTLAHDLPRASSDGKELYGATEISNVAEVGPRADEEGDASFDHGGLSSGPGTGLRNLTGEYNCFLNVVIQSLWHLPVFSRALQASIPAKCSSAAHDPDMAVAEALRQVFVALDLTGGRANSDNVSSVNGNGAHMAVAPTALRKALAVLTRSEGALFSEHEMADASEALQAIFQAVHRAVIPPKGSKHASPITPPPPSASTPGCPDPQSSSASGLFLDQECGYCSIVHRCFGLDVEECMECVACHKRTRTLRFTKFLHLVPATALNLALKHVDDITTMEAAMRHIDGSDAKPCDTDVGGCGTMNVMTHTLGTAPSAPTGYKAAAVNGVGKRGRGGPMIFCMSLLWESASVEREMIAETLRNISTTIDLAAVYDKFPAGRGGLKYKLRCVMCYYGEHYAAFAISEVGAGSSERAAQESAGERWLLFDDASTKEAGSWEDVMASCEMGRMQPCVLFYQREATLVDV